MLRKINLFLAIIATLIISSTVFAQQNEDLEKQVESNMNLQNAQRRIIPERDNERRACLNHTTITAGLNDNLAAPFEATSPTSQLTQPYLPTNLKSFDDPTVNKIFAHSFPMKTLRPCESRICKAQLLIRVCNSGQAEWINDKLYVGSFVGNLFTPSIYYAPIWSANEANQCKDVKIPISGTQLPFNLVSLDVLMQDDSTIDYMQLDFDF